MKKDMVTVVVTVAVALILVWTVVDLRGMWVTRKIVDEAGPAFMTCIAIDKYDRIHTLKAIEDQGFGQVRYRMIDGQHTYTVSGTAVGMDLAVDDLGSAHFAVIAETGIPEENFLYYGYSGLDSDGVEYLGSGMAPYAPSIAVDSSRNVHITYSENGNITYVTNSGGEWTNRTLLSIPLREPFENDAKTSVALDSKGFVHVCYAADGVLSYITNSSGSWIDSGLTYYGGITAFDMAVDNQDTVHICYTGSLNGTTGVIYINDQAGQWSEGVLAFEMDRLDIASLSMRIYETAPRIAYEYLDLVGTQRIGYLAKEGGAWSASEIRTIRHSYAGSCDLALSTDGAAYIAFPWADNMRISTRTLTMTEALMAALPGILIACVVLVIGQRIFVRIR